MIIQFNSDKHVNSDYREKNYFKSQISAAVQKYATQISRIEVHISDENNSKGGIKDIRCLLEIRLEGLSPFVVKCEAEDINLSISGALEKLKVSLDTKLGRLNNHHQN